LQLIALIIGFGALGAATLGLIVVKSLVAAGAVLARGRGAVVADALIRIGQE
jgi:hypothetical protein